MRVNLALLICLIAACRGPQNYVEESVPAETPMTVESARSLEESPDLDTLYVTAKTVVFFTPNNRDLQALNLDQATQDGILMAVGDFAYYASLVADSLQAKAIPVLFTDKKYISLPNPHSDLVIDKSESGALMGVAMYDGKGSSQVVYGLQTHLALWASLSDYFSMSESVHLPLLDYFKEINPRSLHVYTSHGEILNQTGQRINPNLHTKFSSTLARRASKYRMSFYGYYKFRLADSLVATICRVPSRYDESAINLFIWDPAQEKVVRQLELAENIWNDKWILVKDSWINQDPSTGNFEIVQRQREARIDNGVREETDTLYRWIWSSKTLQRASAKGLSLRNYPLKDWASYEEPPKVEVPTEISIIDEEFVWLPLETGDLTYENVILEIPKGYNLEKEPIPNQFNKGQIDTLFTLSKNQLQFKFYRTPEDNVVIGGTISTGAVSFKKGIKVGMDKTEFSHLFSKLVAQEQLPDLIYIKSKNGDRVFSYQFKNDTLASIQVTNYIH